jgi:hypothetical protein
LSHLALKRGFGLENGFGPVKTWKHETPHQGAWKSWKTWNFTPRSVKTRKTWKFTSASVKITKIHISDRERVKIRTGKHENHKKRENSLLGPWKAWKAWKTCKITSCSVKIMKSHAVNAKTRNSHPEAWKSWNTWKLTPALEIVLKWKKSTLFFAGPTYPVQ